MKFTHPLTPAALLAFGLSLSPMSAVAQDTERAAVTADTVLATVNGEEITGAHLAILRARLPQQYQSIPDERLFDGLMQQAINQILLKDLVTDVPMAIAVAIEVEEQALLASVAADEIARNAVTPEALEELYEETYADQAPGREYSAAHILVPTEAEAFEIVTELEAGADFANLARQRSTGPSGPNGGDLGWFGLGAMVPPFEMAVVTLDEGEVSAPVQTQFGWHVILLKDTRLVNVPQLSEVEGDLAAELQERAIQGELDSLKDNADMDRVSLLEIDPSFLSNPELLDRQ